MSLTVTAGGALSQSVSLAAEGNGWQNNEEEGLDERLLSFSGLVYWYPKRDGALYIKGGLAYMTYRIDDAEDELTTSGFGPQLGVGYQLRVVDNFSIQPYANAAVTIPTGDLQLNGDRQAENVGLSLLQVGIGVTWH